MKLSNQILAVLVAVMMVAVLAVPIIDNNISDIGKKEYITYTNSGMSVAEGKVSNEYKISWDPANANNIIVNGEIYVVTFDKNKGNDPSFATKEVVNGQTYGQLPTVTRDGYTFVGWYNERIGGNLIESSTTVALSKNQTLYAHWEGAEYTVVFDGNGGTPTIEEKEVTYGEPYGELPTATRTGYNFGGWFTQAEGGEAVSPEKNVEIVGDHYLYAHWTAINYLVSFSAGVGGSVSSTPELSIPYDTGYTISGNTVTIGETTVTATADTGYSFAGWNPSTSGTIAGQTTFVASFTADEYTLTLNANGGSVNPSTKTIVYNGTYGELPTPTRTGHIFTGWYDAQTDGNLVNSSTTVDTVGNRTIYAHWDIETYNISFSAGPNGSISPSETIIVEYGTAYTISGNTVTIGNVTATATPDTGYSFKKWTPASSGTVSGPMTFSATFNANEYTVTYDANGGSVSPSSKLVTYGSTYKTLPEPTRTGYTFGGWFDAQTGGNAITSSTVVATASDHTIYAHWTINTYTVTFTAGANGSLSSTPELTVDYGTAYTINGNVITIGTTTVTATPNTGYSFSAWTPATSGTISAQTTFVASFSANDYTVTFNANGGSVSTPSKTVTYNQAYGELPTPTWAGHIFGGWYDAQTGGNVVDAETVVNTAGNHTLYAYWTIENYAVNFTAGAGGSLSSSPTLNIDYGTAYTVNGTSVTIGSTTVTAIPDTGYSFNTWTPSTSGTVTGAITFSASFTVNSYTITFDANGGSVSTTSKTVEYGSAYGTLPTPTWTGHTFQGWYDAQTGGNVVTALSEMNTASNHTLYAHWTTDTYTVTFTAGVGGSVLPTELTIEYGTSYTISGNTITIGSNTVTATPDTGYAFSKWTPQTNGTITGATTFTASFSLVDYTVTFNANGGSVSTASKTVNYGTIYGTLPTPTWTGHTFDGWYDAQTGGSIVTSTTNVSVASDHTLYAHWTIITFTVSFSAGANGSIVPTQPMTVDYGTAYSVSGNILTVGSTTITATPNTGYSFSAWSPTGSGTVTSAMSFTASFTANTYTLTYNANGGSVSPSSKTVTYDQTYGELATPTRTGYTFGGWFDAQTGGNAITSSTAMTTASDHTIYAHWTPIQYMVSFTSQTGGSVSPSASLTIDYDTTYTVNNTNRTVTINTPTPTVVTATANTGYEFTTWTPSSSGTITGAVTFTAGFKQVATISFVAESPGSVSTNSLTADVGSTYTVSDNTVTFGSTTVTATLVDNYYFIGWSPLSNGSGTVTGNTTFTAHYMAMDSPEIVQVACSGATTWILTEDGKVYGCGDNQYGQQGLGASIGNVYSFTDRTPSGKTVTQVACSENTTWFVTSDGKVYGCGDNQYGQQGSGNWTTVTIFTDRTPSGKTVTQVACSNNTTWIVTQDGKVYGCGNNEYGQQSSGNSYNNVTTFTDRTPSGKVVTQVACSNNTTWIVTQDGKVYGCGQNTSGNQGSGTYGEEDIVTTFTDRTPSGKTVTQIACSDYTTWIVTQDGKVYGCGDGYGGNQGSGDTDNVTSFTDRTPSGKTVTQVACPDGATWIVTQDGKVYGCGNNDYGQQGSGTSGPYTEVNTFTDCTPSDETVTQVICSQCTTWILTSDGKVYGCGMNTNGQQGNGTTGSWSSGFVTSFTDRTPSGKTATQVACSDYTTWIVTSDGKVYGCGSSGNGQQGSDDTDDVTTFTDRTPTGGGPGSVHNQFTVSFATPTNGTVSPSTSQTVYYGTEYVITNNTITIGNTTVTATASAGYKFGGWTPSTSGTVTNDTVFTATFVQAALITFTAESPGSVNADNLTVDLGSTYTVSDNTVTFGSTTVTATLVDNYYFIGWSPLSNGSGTVTGNTTFTAHYMAMDSPEIVQVACSQNTTWFVTSDGKVYGCGTNDCGQQGNGTTGSWDSGFVTSFTDRTPSGETVTQVVCSDQTTWILTSDGKVYGCGANWYRNQGSGNTDDTIPSFTDRTPSGKTVTQVACADGTTWLLTQDGKVYGCGWNSNGQQSSGNTTDVTTFTDRTPSGKTVTQVACSQNTTWFVTSDGKVYGAGSNWNGQQGSGTSGSGTNVTTFTDRTPSGKTVTQVVCSEYTTWIVTQDGKVYGCGKNSDGQQGDDTTTNVLEFTDRTPSGKTVTQVACSEYTTWFLTSDGKVYGTGSNDNGQQGDGTTTNVWEFTDRTPSGKTVTQMALSGYTTWILTSDGKVYGCGNNEYGNQGNGTTTNVLEFTDRTPSGKTVTQVACTSMTTWILTQDSKVYGCGMNWYGQQSSGNTSENGVTTFTDRTPGGTVPGSVHNQFTVSFATPTGGSVSPSTSMTVYYGTEYVISDNTITIGNTVITATASSGYEFAGWTPNVSGTVTADTEFEALFEEVISGPQVACNYNVTWIVTSDGKVYGTGDNNYGQQGNGTSGSSAKVTTFTDRTPSGKTVTQVACTDNMTWIVTEDGKVYGTGYNSHGQQGSGNTTTVTSFTDRTPSGKTVTQVACTDGITWIITSDGKVYGCGRNDYGQQGSGSTTDVTTFTDRTPSGKTVTQVACSDKTTWIVTSDGKVYGTGDNNYGQQGNGTSGSSAKVTTFTDRTPSGKTVTQVACTPDTTWIVTQDGKVYGCGDNGNGQQGSGDTTTVTSFTDRTPSGKTVTQVICSISTNWIVTQDGKVYGCGSNNKGQQGSGDTTNVTSFTDRTPSGKTVTQVACSTSTTWMVVQDGKVYGCGGNSSGNQGSGNTTNVTSFTERYPFATAGLMSVSLMSYGSPGLALNDVPIMPMADPVEPVEPVNALITNDVDFLAGGSNWILMPLEVSEGVYNLALYYNGSDEPMLWSDQVIITFSHGTCTFTNSGDDYTFTYTDIYYKADDGDCVITDADGAIVMDDVVLAGWAMPTEDCLISFVGESANIVITGDAESVGAVAVESHAGEYEGVIVIDSVTAPAVIDGQDATVHFDKIVATKEFKVKNVIPDETTQSVVSIIPIVIVLGLVMGVVAYMMRRQDKDLN